MKKLPIYFEEERKILHILSGFYCNNNCIFCFEEDRDSRYKYVISQKDSVKKIIFSNKDAREILFTCGEPTLNPDLSKYIAYAKSAGIKTIGIISNGRRFAYKNYAVNLLKLGLNSITISIHGHNAKLHDALTRTKNTFEQTSSGLMNFCELKKEYEFKLQTSTVINKLNYKHLHNLYEFLSPLPIDKIVLNMILPEGRGITYFSKLIPRFSDVVKEIHNLVQKIPDEKLERISIIDFPYCTVTNLPDVICGHIEKFIQYEPLNSLGHKRIEKEKLNATINKINTKSNSSDNNSYYITSRQFKEQFFRIKRDECCNCQYDNVCPGVWKIYIDNFGWGEFIPQK